MERRLSVALALLVIVGVGFQLLPIAVIRYAAISVLILQICLELRVHSKQFLTSPLFLLGASALVFFSFVLGVVDTTYPGLPFHTIESHYGSDAERIFVIFGLCCLIVHSLISAETEQSLERSQDMSTWSEKYVIIYSAIALLVSSANVINYLSMQSGGLYFVTIRSLAAPLLGFCVIFLSRLSLKASRSQKLLIAGVIVLSIAGLFFMHEGKKPFFIIVAGLLYLARLNNLSVKQLFALAATFILFAIILVQVVQIIRVPHYSLLSTDKGPPASMIGTILKAKVILRQTETRYCFHQVIDKNWEQPFSVAKQFFWLKALVPSFLWSDKPSLSMGQIYGAEYCNEQIGSRHTTSISLLGQPIIQGGWIGLLLHGGLLIMCLGGLVWLIRTPQSLATVMVVALLPWLIDFDQEFAMFVANAVKFFLAQSPLALLAALSVAYTKSASEPN